MRTGKTERKIDAMEAETITGIDNLYSKSLLSAFSANKKALNRIRAIMDGEEKPPRRCVTDQQKALWHEKKLNRILRDSGLIESMAEYITSAGKSSVSRIKRGGLDIYRIAYKSTLDSMKG